MTGDRPPRLPPGSSPDAGLPRWVLGVSLVGLAILAVSTLPALLARRRLDIVERRLSNEVRQKQAAAERYSRELQAIHGDEYVVKRAMRDLLAPGPMLAGTTGAAALEAGGTPPPR